LFARSLLNLQQQPLGFERGHVLLARLNPRLAGYKPADVGVLYRKLHDRLSALPGVGSATLASYSPFSGSTSKESMTVDGYAPKAGENVETENIIVGAALAQAEGMS